ncbi:MAG: hypothetical protein IJX99_04025 [Clostridia bacterium]|nr:hypothetical protein [Clostridia bacterium]
MIIFCKKWYICMLLKYVYWVKNLQMSLVNCRIMMDIVDLKIDLVDGY